MNHPLYTLCGSVDFDIIIHFGKLENIDLMSRGIYFIQATLLYGFDQRNVIAPGILQCISTCTLSYELRIKIIYFFDCIIDSGFILVPEHA